MSDKYNCQNCKYEEVSPKWQPCRNCVSEPQADTERGRKPYKWEPKEEIKPDDSPDPMWRGEEDAFLVAVEKYREKIDRSPDHLYRHAAHAMLDELVELYNAQKKPA